MLKHHADCVKNLSSSLKKTSVLCLVKWEYTGQASEFQFNKHTWHRRNEVRGDVRPCAHEGPGSRENPTGADHKVQRVPATQRKERTRGVEMLVFIAKTRTAMRHLGIRYI